ncbi:type III effector protein XopD [Paracidovorax citrulli]|nr:type III effector protein XopD [Paracidovorax citrulli]REG71453.1 type III effector protein XopD [Paracidovorax citrulli]RLJ96006.1 type III effector protein XopD [Paracidovorax citrulli]
MVHCARKPKPVPKSVVELVKILPRFGKGEAWESLCRDFPGIQVYFSDYGINERGFGFLLNHLDSEQIDNVVEQTENRINIICSDDFKIIALKTAATTIETCRAKFQEHAKFQELSSSTLSNKSEGKYYRNLIDNFMDILDRFEAGESIPSLAETVPGITGFIGNQGFSKKAKYFLEHIKPEEKERIELAVKRRNKNVSAPKPSGVPSPFSGTLRYIHENPDYLINTSKAFSNPSNSIADKVCDKNLSIHLLKKIVNIETGELTATGEKLISNADPQTRRLIRANFKLRFRVPSTPAAETASPAHQEPSHGQHYAAPNDSFFSGFSGEVRRYHEPSTPQYPPAAPAFSEAGPYHAPYYYGQPYAPPGDSFFSGFSGEVRRHYEPPTPQYPPATPASSEASLYYDPYYNPYHGQQYAPPGDSFFSGFSAEVRRHHEPSTPQYPQNSTSTFGDLSSLNEGAYSTRDFDLNTPAEVTQPWRGDGYDDVESAASPERIDVDALPSPQNSSAPAGQELALAEEEWLGDEHLITYVGTIADRLRGQPGADLLNFADPLLVTQLIQGESEQRNNAMYHIIGRGGPIVFLPVNAPDSHWSLLVIDQRTGNAFHYDSLVSPGDARNAVHTRQYQLASRAARAMGITGPVQGMPIARQRDGHSCGDHVLQATEQLAQSVIAGTFGQPGTMDLSDLQTDRGLIADTIANATADRNAEPPPATSRTHERPAKKNKKWWKF